MVPSWYEWWNFELASTSDATGKSKKTTSLVCPVDAVVADVEFSP